MYVKITGAKKDTYWYADKIGQVFEVAISGESGYWWLGKAGHFIDREDCEIIEPLKDSQPAEDLTVESSIKFLTSKGF